MRARMEESSEGKEEVEQFQLDERSTRGIEAKD
jgi:hypothetical protein